MPNANHRTRNSHQAVWQKDKPSLWWREVGAMTMKIQVITAFESATVAWGTAQSIPNSTRCTSTVPGFGRAQDGEPALFAIALAWHIGCGWLCSSCARGGSLSTAVCAPAQLSCWTKDLKRNSNSGKPWCLMFDLCSWMWMIHHCTVQVLMPGLQNLQRSYWIDRIWHVSFG